MTGRPAGIIAHWSPHLRRVLQYLRHAPRDRRRLVAFGVVAIAHVLAIWLLLGDTPPPAEPSRSTETQVVLLPGQDMPAAAMTEPPMAQASFTVPQPLIEIAPDAPSDAAFAGTSGTGQFLAPRPDPAHVNAAPAIPAPLREAAKATGLVLRVLVAADGKVADAEVARSSGDDSIDVLAMRFVVGNWRFLPAMLGGRAIQDWTTVFVLLSPQS